MILDNLRVHHSKPVKAWLADNADLKRGVHSEVPARSEADAPQDQFAATEHPKAA